MTATKTNERPGTRAEARSVRMSASKARAVLDLVRGLDVRSADEVLRFSERDAALVVRKLLRSAVANAENNDDQIADDLFVAACYADEGRTMRRFRPRARGRASRIRKRSCHIVIIVSRMPEAMLERRRAKDAKRPGSRAARRAGQQAAEQGRPRRTRRRGGGADARAVAETEEAEAIVDQQAPAVAAVEEQVESEEQAEQAEVQEQAEPEAQVEAEEQAEAGEQEPEGTAPTAENDEGRE